MKKSEKLSKLFDETQKSWKAIAPESEGIRCPICWSEFFWKSSIEKELISIEDVPQKSWGSNWEVITCTKCNNTFGTKYQGRVSGLKDIENLKSGRSNKKHRAKIVTDQGEFNAEIYTKNGLIWMKGSKSINKPVIAQQWLQLRDKARSFTSVKILLRQQFVHKALSMVLLRDSYLLAFYFLGYPYLCISQVQEIRTILHEDKSVPDGAMLTLPFDPYTLKDKTKNGRFFWVQAPEKLAGILVRWVVPEIGNRFIVLPFFPYQWQSYQELCKVWNNASKNRKKIKLILVAMEFEKSARYSQRLKISKESNEIVTLSGEE